MKVRALPIVLAGCVALASCTGPRPLDAHGQQATTARAAMTQQADQLFAALDAGTEVARGVGDGCDAGQHNWKIDDPYDWRCTRVLTRITASETPDTTTVIAQAIGSVRGAGCVPDEREVDMVTRYWADYGLRGRTDAGRPYSIDNLPSFTASCPGGLRLETSFRSPAGLAGRVFPLSAQEMIESVAPEVAAVPAGDYVVWQASAVYHTVAAR